MISTKVIMTSLSLILALNNFVCTTYKQWTVPWIQNVLLSQANIFLANFEAKHIYPYIKGMSLLYLRNIEDTFMVWKDTKAELMTFIKELNEKYKTTKFDFQISPR